jgi:O-methyltransferase
MKQRLVILGAGQMGRAAEALLDWNEFCLCAFGDNFSGAWDPAARPPVLPVKEALSAAPDLVLLGVLDEERSGQLERQARSLGYRGAFLRLRDLYRCFDMRGAVLRRMVERLQAVPGDMAELGVYRGDFVWQLNVLFPDRRLYLFDTFQGFDPRDVRQKPAGGGCDRRQDFSDTSVEAVLARCPTRSRPWCGGAGFPILPADWRPSSPWSAWTPISMPPPWRGWSFSTPV